MTASAGTAVTSSGAVAWEAVSVGVAVLGDGSTFEAFAVGAVACTVGEFLRAEPPRVPRRGAAALGVGDTPGSSGALWAPPELESTTPSATSTVVCDGDPPVGAGESGADELFVDEGGDGLAGVGFTPASVSGAASELAGAASAVEASPESGPAHATAAGNPTAAPTPSATANAPTLPTHQA
ncbi:MAG TPA: hypothetical protein VL634_04405 [Mycobacterium sp.]|nr:hypothetical protein [Mycobacterium sp.]